MAAPSNPRRWKYDVFVSFRGKDIRKSFMDHLFNDFKQKGIHAFRDDNKLPKGEEISPHLYKAIEESRFLIVIFSKDYASSSWCLRELVKILECKKIENPKHEVRIIFYDAKPDVVRKQKKSYEEAFINHEVSNKVEVDKWREALSMAANLSGWDLQDMTNGFESKFIDSISKEILKTLCDGPLHVGENLVGIDFHFEKLNLSHFVGSDKVNMIGICGISGIGKTTLAKAIYNLIYVHFEGSCFCEDVKEVRKRQGLIQVQLHMIRKIMKIEDLTISSVGEGIMVIKKMMSSKSILLVLDDVDDHEQLEALAGSPDWFFPGSLIIFTGKDRQLLRSHRVDEIHEMGSLEENKALELFSLYAFGKSHPTEDFEEFATQIVKYLQGHPLALKVLGRLLYDKSVYVWKSELDRIQTYPNSEIVQKLRPSFDSLTSDQKRMFLDIACAFIGVNKDFAASVLDSSHCFAYAIIEVLADKFLITVSQYNMSLQMHELFQSMAREIIREEFIKTGKQRRLCISSAIYNAPSEKKVPMTEATEILVLLLRKSSQKVHIDANSFALMKNLRILKIYAEEEFDQKQELKGYNVKYSESLYFLSNELSMFCWHGCPFKYLPTDFYPESIVAIDLSYSHIKQLWTTPKSFRRLKVMKLRYCCNLTTTPDFSEITNLEELSLEGCVNLVSVHPSIGMLKRLVVLNLRDCKRLREKHPSFVSSLINLESLSFGDQWRIQPRWWTSITTPFGLLSKQPHPQRSVMSSLAGLRMLRSLNFSYCNLEHVPESIGGLSCLYSLDLKGNNFTSLPGSLSQLSNLHTLCVNGCKKLEVLPELPSSLWFIRASDCTSLREVTGSSKGPFRNGYNHFINCPKLFKNVSIDSEGSISKTQCVDSSITSQGFIHQISPFLRYAGFQTNMCEFFLQDTSYFCLNIVYHGNSIPEWFTNRSTENHVKVELPSDWCYDKFRGFGTCVVFKCKNPWKSKGTFRNFDGYYSVKNFDGASLVVLGYIPVSIQDYFRNEVIGIQDSYMIWLHYTPLTFQWKEAKNFVTFCFEESNEGYEVKEFGVRLVYDEDIEQEADLSMLQGLPTPTQHGGAISLEGHVRDINWSW